MTSPPPPSSPPPHAAFEVEERDEALSLMASERLRRRAALRAGARNGAVTLLIGGVVFAPDCLAGFGNPGQAPRVVFLATALLCSLFVGAATGLVRALRKERWTLDVGAKELRVERWMFRQRAARQEAIDLDQIASIRAHGRRLEAAIRNSTLTLSLLELGSAEQALKARERLSGFIARHRLDL